VIPESVFWPLWTAYVFWFGIVVGRHGRVKMGRKYQSPPPVLEED
jgi:hypothetical protein